MTDKAVIEGLLFVCGSEGLSLEKISEILNISIEKSDNIINDLISDYESNDRGIRIERFGEMFKLVTKKECSDFLKKLVPDEEDFLTQSNLETLAIIAYNQPITRLQVEEIRGVSSSHIIRKLLIRDLIMEDGRSDMPGRPFLYKTTDYFLDYFGLESISQLPDINFEKVDKEDNDLFESRYKEEI